MPMLKYWIWLAEGMATDTAAGLMVLDHFGSPERAFYAQPEELEELELRPAHRAALSEKSLDRAEQILADCHRLGVRIMTIQDGDYPQRLRSIADPPLVLYIRGKVFHFDEEAAIAVVGARNPSPYGEKWAERLGLELAAGGALVLSGIAEGLDTCAVKGALKGGGPVVCVLAGGVDVPFPVENRFLYQDVAAAGALISESPPGTSHRGWRFPRRNRILSGLSLGVLAVECRAFGGTMNTIGHALEQDRDIFALPGAVDAPMSEGPNRLIQQGAKLVTCGRDILEEYRDRFPGRLSQPAPMEEEMVQARLDDLEQHRRERADQGGKKTPPAKQPEKPRREVIPRSQQKSRFTDDEMSLLWALKEKNYTADQLVDMTQIPAKRVLSALTMLQIQGAVEEQPGKRFAALVELEE